MRSTVLSSLTILLLLSSCSTESPENYFSTEDIVLQFQLKTVGGDISYFKLPDPTDYQMIPQDPNNPLTVDKVALGKMLFHETFIAQNPEDESSMETYSCASCHHAAAGFQSGLRQGIGEGGIGFGTAGEGRTKNPIYTVDMLDVQPIKSPSTLNVAFQKVMLWNGQFGATAENIGTEAQWTTGTPKAKNHLGFEGPETQAIAGLEVHRLQISKTILEDGKCLELFDKAFADIPEASRYTNINAGLAIAAYERTLLPTQAPFQKWLRGDTKAMTEQQKQGAILFFGKAKCYECHSGPALNDTKFHAIGMDDLVGADIHGRLDGAIEKGRGGFTKNPEDNYKFKTPQLYNLKEARFYGHGASFTDLRAVMVYKNQAQAENSKVPANQLSEMFDPLELTEEEIDLLTIFVKDGLNDGNLQRYTPQALPSGNCFPNADPLSKSDMGCNN
ncbi:MAG: cytochrome-c peroxidase [Flavobacteriaceae bacterium]|nr:cytochrome-c peroxidase [Flavobacteriaceae bacterium]